LFQQEIKEKRDEDLLVLPTDAAIFEDSSFKVTNWGWNISIRRNLLSLCL